MPFPQDERNSDGAAIERIRALARHLAPEPTGLPAGIDPLPGIRAVLFDVYGTLLVSASGDVGTLLQGDRAGPLAEALREAGLAGRIEEAAAEGVRRFHAAITADHARRRAAGAVCPEVDVRELWAKVLADLAGCGLIDRPAGPAETRDVALGYEMRVNPVWPMPGARDILRTLAGRAVPLGIVSNAQFYTPLLLDALLGGPLESLGFDPALCAWSWIEGEAKPAPRLFAPVLARLRARGIPSRAVLYVGNDMLNDVATAAGLGCRTVLFAGDRRSLRLRADDARCSGVKPDRVVLQLADVAAIAIP